ncbi:uncharacterized protein LOC142325397 isoform X2 [Lycorma delicatula]
MKYPQLVSMPEAVRCWLEEQLEARGIDAAIYSRYIFSLLQQKSLDDFPTQEVRRGRKRGHRDYALDLDQQKRSAAVECLMSASDQKSGIEALVDELCAKLKVIQSEASRPQETTTTAVDTETVVPIQNLLPSHDLELKYYSAFPPLISKGSVEVFTSQLLNTSVWNGKKILGCSFGKNQSVSNIGCKEKFVATKSKWEEENKENQGFKDVGNEKMRSRSMIKQQITQKVRKNMAKSLDRKDDMLKLKVTLDGGKTRRLDDPNLARLLSKFDYGMRALWANDKSADDLSGCDEDLPMDFQQLLDSPDMTNSSDSLPFEFYKNINNKQNVMSSFNGPFIQCGTNITSSIWSEKTDGISISIEGCNGSDSCNDNINNSTLLPSLSGCSVWSNNENDTSILENKKISDPWGFGENIYLEIPCKKNSDFENAEKSYLQEKKWSSDIENANCMITDEEKFFTCKNYIDSSLSTLNHNKEDSCFKEVVPIKSIDKLIEKYSPTKPKLLNCWKRPEQVTGVVWDDDEDLLTSMRTHFQPISSKETNASVHDRVVPSVPKYADGTTFQISNSLDKPCFLRSESGAFYLDSDKDQKYREFNDDSLETSGNFIPKFKVCQNEKFCQTEEISVSSDSEEFYFPGDERHAEDCLEKDSTATCITVDGWVAAWPAGIWSNTPQPWCEVWNAGVNKAQEDGDHYLQLRDEILEEGEELLSNLSSMQDLLLNSEEALPVNPPSQVESNFVFKTNTIPLSSEMERKVNERHITLKIPQKDHKR